MTIRVETDAGVVTLTLDRPEKRNAVTREMWMRLSELCGEIGADHSVHVVILTGAGAHFCVGGDIGELADIRSSPEAAAEMDRVIEGAALGLATLAHPTIAAVRGYCIGGGMSLALNCDIRIAHSNSRFGIPAAKLGNVYSITESAALQNAVGLAQAKRLLFTGEQIGALEAMRIGLIQEIADDQLAQAHAMALTISANAPLSLTGSKEILNAIARGRADAESERLRSIRQTAHTSADNREAAQAFLEKRSPRFIGR